MVLTLHADITGSEVRIDFNDVRSMANSYEWDKARIGMRDGTFVMVTETVDEIMEMVSGETT